MNTFLTILVLGLLVVSHVPTVSFAQQSVVVEEGEAITEELPPVDGDKSEPEERTSTRRRTSSGSFEALFIDETGKDEVFGVSAQTDFMGSETTLSGQSSTAYGEARSKLSLKLDFKGVDSQVFGDKSLGGLAFSPLVEGSLTLRAPNGSPSPTGGNFDLYLFYLVNVLRQKGNYELKIKFLRAGVTASSEKYVRGAVAGDAEAAVGRTAMALKGKALEGTYEYNSDHFAVGVNSDVAVQVGMQKFYSPNVTSQDVEVAKALVRLLPQLQVTAMGRVKPNTIDVGVETVLSLDAPFVSTVSDAAAEGGPATELCVQPGAMIRGIFKNKSWLKVAVSYKLCRNALNVSGVNTKDVIITLKSQL